MPFSSLIERADDTPKIRPDYMIKLFNESDSTTDQVWKLKRM